MLEVRFCIHPCLYADVTGSFSLRKRLTRGSPLHILSIDENAEGIMESAQSLVLRFLISAVAERRTVAAEYNELLLDTLQRILAIFLGLCSGLISQAAWALCNVQGIYIS